MPMNPIERRGLRPVHLNARSATKAQIAVQPDDVLIVSDDVAEQLAKADTGFKLVDDVPAPAELDDGLTDSEREADKNAAEARAALAAPKRRRRAAKGA